MSHLGWGLTGKGHEGTFWNNVLHLNRNLDYTDVCMCLNSGIYTYDLGEYVNICNIL